MPAVLRHICNVTRHRVTPSLNRLYSSHGEGLCRPPHLTAYSWHGDTAIEDQYGRHTYGSLLVQSHKLASKIQNALGRLCS